MPSKKWRENHNAYMDVQRERYTAIYNLEPIRHPYHPDERHYGGTKGALEQLANEVLEYKAEEYLDRFLLQEYGEAQGNIETKNTYDYESNGLSTRGEGWGLSLGFDKEFIFGTEYFLIEWISSVGNLTHMEQYYLLNNTNKIESEGVYNLNRIFLSSLSVTEMQELEGNGYINSHLEATWNHQSTKNEYKNNLKKIRILKPINKVNFSFLNTDEVMAVYWKDDLSNEGATFDYTKFKSESGSLSDCPIFSRPATAVEKAYISPQDSTLNQTISTNNIFLNPSSSTSVNTSDRFIYEEGKDPDDDYFHADYPIYPLRLVDLSQSFKELIDGAVLREATRRGEVERQESLLPGSFSNWFTAEGPPFCCDFSESKESIDTTLLSEHIKLIELLEKSYEGARRMNEPTKESLIGFVKGGGVPFFSLKVPKVKNSDGVAGVKIPKARRELTDSEKAWLAILIRDGNAQGDSHILGPEKQFIYLSINISLIPLAFDLESEEEQEEEEEDQSLLPHSPQEEEDIYENVSSSEFKHYSFGIGEEIKSQYPKYGSGVNSISSKAVFPSTDDIRNTIQDPENYRV